MTTATEFLNMIAKEHNITDKNVCINVAIVTMVKSGVELETAFDMIVGEGAYKKMAGDVWTKLRAKAAA